MVSIPSRLTSSEHILRIILHDPRSSTFHAPYARKAQDLECNEIGPLPRYRECLINLTPMQLRERKPVDYSDDHAVFSKYLSESEGSESSESTNYSMGNVVGHGKRKAESDSMSEGDVEVAPRSWGSFHLRSVIGGRRGQNSNQDGGRFLEDSRLAGMNTLEQVDALVRGAAFSSVAMPSARNLNTEDDSEDSDGMLRLSLPSLERGTRKRKKVEDLERAQRWDGPSRSLSFREAYSCNTAHLIRDKTDGRTTAPIFAPTVKFKEVSSGEERCELSSYPFHPNVQGKKPVNTSLDRLLEELSTVNVASKIGHDDESVIETSGADMFNMCEVVVVEKEKKTTPNAIFEAVATTLPDSNKNFTPSEDGHGMVKGSPSPMKRLRRLRHVRHLKREIEDERITDLLDCHDFENIVHDTRKTKRSGHVVDSGFDWENITPQEFSPAYDLEENYPNHDHLRLNNNGGNSSSLVRRIGKVEKILSVKDRLSGPDAIFRVKESHKSYRQVVSVQGSVLQKHCPQLLRIFLKRMDHLGRSDGHTLDDMDSPDFDPMYTKIDRIIAAEQRGCKKCYLVKWCGLPYSEVTWEKEENLQRDVAAICRFHKNTLRISSIRRNEALSQGAFKDGRRLRDYQEAGVAWLDHNFKNRTNCILADEMGLGKTIQSVAMLENLRMKRRIRGPFLVVAPVSTLGHWQREIESLTDMNCVVYTGNQEDRQIIRNHEFYYTDGNPCELKFNVLLTSFEILMKDQNKLAKETWQYIIVDEAHRLKSRASKTAQSLRQLHVRHGGLLLLTGTPVQNNTKEIFSLLNLLDQEEFESEEEFLQKYGDIKAAEQIKDLQDYILRPRLLRRMKEDVEKSIPLKEETIVWVELTREQRAYYRGIYENNIATLLKGSMANNMPNLRNVAMELRKLCNHPFLCDGLEENIVSKHRASNDGSTSNLAERLLSQSSGKMVLVDKLLPKLKEAGRRVLIFSQFTMMLDLLEDYLLAKGYFYERIDGKIRGSERQAAIDRYSAKDSNIFVFLLSTRAGGLGITLTAADTCIIYDSDWNPQNDLQAMARCHRIGQTKDVKIYRLITRNTYEQRLFECSSRKYGLDEAILGNRMGVDISQDHNKKIESLLKHGAYDLLKDDGEAASEFSSQNIDQILEQRTQQRQIGGRTSNTFSIATFISNPDIGAPDNPPTADSEAAPTWQEMLPEACEKAVMEAMTSKAPAVPFSGGIRKRTRSGVDYKVMDVSVENSSDETDVLRKMRKGSRARISRAVNYDEGSEDFVQDVKEWSEQELKRLEDQLFALGRGRTEQIMMEARLTHHGSQEVEEVSEALIQLCHYMQECSELGTCPSTSSPTNNAVIPSGKSSSFANSKCDRRRLQRSKNVALLPPSSVQQETSKATTVTKVETRSKRSNGIRVSVHQSRLSATGEEAQPSGGDIQMDTAEERWQGGHVEPPVVPAVALKAMQSLEFQERLQKEAPRYLQMLEDHQILAQALQSQNEDFPPRVAFRSKKLPDWWGKQEDADLLKAAHLYGHKFFKRMKSDSSLSFISRVNAPVTTKNNNRFRAKNLDHSVQSKSRHVQDVVGKMRGEMPSDSVLSSRLKKLLEALRDEASKVPEKAAMAEIPPRKADEKGNSEVATRKPEAGNSACGVWGSPPSSSKQLSMTKILTASLAIEATKKEKGKAGAHSKSGAGMPQSRGTLAGLPDCNMAPSKALKVRSPYLSGSMKASRFLVLKTKQTSRSQRTSSAGSPQHDDVEFKVPKDEKRKDNAQSPRPAPEKQRESGGGGSRKQKNISSFFRSRTHH